MKWIIAALLVALPFLCIEKASPGAILPVQHEGRIKPLETVARTTHVLLNGKEGSHPTKRFLKMLFAPQEVLQEKIIRSDHPDLFPKSVLSIEEISPKMSELLVETLPLKSLPKEALDPYQKGALKLWNRIDLFLKVTHAFDEKAPPYIGITQASEFDPSQSWSAHLDDWKEIKESYPDIAPSVDRYMSTLKKEHPRLAWKLRLELYFNLLRPFFWSKVYYIFALVSFLTLALFKKKPTLGVAFLLSAFALHSLGLIMRMAIEGRPPVTNLYSSALFVGWGAVLGALLFSKKERLLLPVSSFFGFITLSLSSALSLSGDTLQMMRAVLDSNFWLTTHVVMITLGYSATFLAGFLAIYALLFRDDLREVSHTVYIIITWALLLSFVGTLLGGIWADQSWGRFWGWDPKENGALMIVLWNSVILHMRLGKFVKHTALLRLTIFGNIVTSFSWFGVNMLGVGLHSYGFIDKAFLWLIAFMGLNLAILSLPRRKEGGALLLFRK